MTEPQLKGVVIPTEAKQGARLASRGGRLSIVVPCFNEEDVLPETIKRLRTLLDKVSADRKDRR